MCNHKICAKLFQINCNKGIGVLLINLMSKDNVLLGLEVVGKYKNQYNLCAGGMESIDNNCFLRTLRKELSEKFKIALSWEQLDHFFKLGRNWGIIIHYNKPIFVGYRPFDVKDLNNKIANNKKSFSHEMSRLKEFNRHSVEKNSNISNFAKAIVRKYNGAVK